MKTRPCCHSTWLSCPCPWGSEAAWKVLWVPCLINSVMRTVVLIPAPWTQPLSGPALSTSCRAEDPSVELSFHLQDPKVQAPVPPFSELGVYPPAPLPTDPAVQVPNRPAQYQKSRLPALLPVWSPERSDPHFSRLSLKEIMSFQAPAGSRPGPSPSPASCPLKYPGSLWQQASGDRCWCYLRVEPEIAGRVGVGGWGRGRS